jgi:hypothetical protein
MAVKKEIEKEELKVVKMVVKVLRLVVVSAVDLVD